METCTLNAYAKLNLTLDILARREDGYHDLAMVMQSISLHDTVTVRVHTPAPGIVCRVAGAALPADDSNLAVKAAKAFCAEVGLAPAGIEIDIEKRIPIAAGMAGGSTDAAAVIRALRQLLAPSVGQEELERIGALVGSDVPYCIRGGTALAEGRGEKLTTLAPAPDFHTVICKPDFPISTPVLFRLSDSCTLQQRPDMPAMLRAIGTGDHAAVAALVKNVFEEVLPEEYHEVFRIKERLLASGACAAQMTGSGPTVFGLFTDPAAAQAAYTALARAYRQTYLEHFV